MYLSLFDAAEIKNEIAERFSVQIHFHDGCGGQYFSIDNPNEKTEEDIIAYFAERNLKADFTENREYFSVKKIK